MSSSSPVSGLLLQDALFEVGAWLQGQGYHFTTVTPATHALVNARADAKSAHDLRDIFGWSRPFEPDLLPTEVLHRMQQAQLLQACSPMEMKARVRFSSLGECLFAHSAFPTTQADAVFFGPDTYRFCQLIQSELAKYPLLRGRILDIGCGAGPGGIVAALTAVEGGEPQLSLRDINSVALNFAGANARLAGLQDVDYSQGDLYAGLAGGFDLIVANPPYLSDPGRRAYRDGGGDLGTGLGVRIVTEGLSQLAPGGRLVLYTGAPVVAGVDMFFAEIERFLRSSGGEFAYRELDPDVFGEELACAAYASVERIAAVALVLQKPAN